MRWRFEDLASATNSTKFDSDDGFVLPSDFGNRRVDDFRLARPNAYYGWVILQQLVSREKRTKFVFQRKDFFTCHGDFCDLE